MSSPLLSGSLWLLASASGPVLLPKALLLLSHRAEPVTTPVHQQSPRPQEASGQRYSIMKTPNKLSQALRQCNTTPTWKPSGFDTCVDVKTNVQMRNACGVTSQALLAHLEHGRRPVQRQAGGSPSTASVHQLAAEGLRGSPQSLPHLETIQHSFGRHAIGGVQAHVGGPAQVATQRMGAEAYATGNSVAFKRSPDLHTAAHEAAHIVQQRAGVQLKGGVGQVGDPYEQHADAVADAVVQGKSAEPLLDRFVGNSGSTSADVQHKRTLGSERLSSSAPLVPLKPSQGFTVGRTGQAIQFQDDKKEGDNGGLVYEGNVGRETELDEEGKPKSKEQRDAEKAAEEAKTPEQRDAERRKPSTQTERKSTTSGKMTVDKDKIGAQVTHTRSFKASCTIPLPAFPALRLVFEFEAKASGSASADTTGAFSIKGTLSVGGSVGAALDFGFISATVKGGIEATCDAINIARAAGGSWTLSAMTGDITGQVVFEGELKIPGLSDIFDGFVAGNKITYPLTKKGTFLTFSGGGIHIPGSDKPDDGRMIPATVTTPWSVSVGPDLQDLLVRLGLATERAKSGLGKAVLSKVDRIIKDTAFKSLHEVRDKVLAFENRLNDRIHELRELSAVPDSGPYKDAYGELLAELIVFEKGLWNVSNMESGAQDAEMEVGRVQQHINRLRARIFNSGLPTPKQRSAGVLDTNEAEAQRLIREKAGALEEQARHTAGHILQGKKPDQVFTKGSPAWEKFRVANNFYFKGNDQRVKGQHEAAIQSYEQAIDTYKQVRNYPGRKD